MVIGIDEQLGNYRLLECIASGGAADVFLAEPIEQPGALLCIKRLRQHLLNQSEYAHMLQHEARIAQNLNHPHIARVLDVGVCAGSHYIAMEYINGVDMRALMELVKAQGQFFPIAYSLSIAAWISEALHHVHCHGTVHRDVTPHNMLFAFDGSVKLIDFGIARAEHLLSQTRTGVLKGKTAYMSPEQIRAERVDHRSDIFSLGVILHEWLSGIKLFEGETEISTMRAIVDEPIYPPSYTNPFIPKAIDAIVMRALAKDKELRYKQASDLGRDILNWLASQAFQPSAEILANGLEPLLEKARDRENARLMRAQSAKTAIEVRLSQDQLKRLQALATANEQDISVLAEQLIAHQLAAN